MSSKIRELKQTLDAQNEMIATAQANKKLMWESVSATYQSMVKFKPEFTASKLGIETNDYPEIRNEDLARLQPAEIVKRFVDVFRVMASALHENREELRGVYAELDGEIEESMATFQRLRLQENSDKKSEAFRSNIVADASSKRSGTPDLVGDRTGSNFGPTLPPTPPSAPGKKEPVQPISTGKPKSGTSTLEAMLSPTSAAKNAQGKDSQKKR